VVAEETGSRPKGMSSLAYSSASPDSSSSRHRGNMCCKVSVCSHGWISKNENQGTRLATGVNKFRVSEMVDEAIGLLSSGLPIMQTNPPVPFCLTMIVVVSAFHLFSAIKFAQYALNTQPQMYDSLGHMHALSLASVRICGFRLTTLKCLHMDETASIPRFPCRILVAATPRPRRVRVLASGTQSSAFLRSVKVSTKVSVDAGHPN
jgi:hypothetical protein